ncbi:PspC domain-containing protein [Phytoactinopolyspora halophila]|nr:PspC domain-containing protein [Phytoactinopolyspora halophila]
MTEQPPDASASEATATTPPDRDEGFRALRRSRDDRVVAGVLDGLGRKLGIDPMILRIVTAVLAVFGGVGIAIYALAWLLIPAEGDQASVLEQAIGRDEVRDAAAVPLALALGAITLISAVVIIGGSFSSLVLLTLAGFGLYVLVKRHGEAGDPGAAGHARSSGDAGWIPGADRPADDEREPGSQLDGGRAPERVWEGTAARDATEAERAEPERAEAERAESGRAEPERFEPERTPAEPVSWTSRAQSPVYSSGWPEGPDWNVPGGHTGYDGVYRAPEQAPFSAGPDGRGADTGDDPERTGPALGWLTFCVSLVSVGVLALFDASGALDPGALYLVMPLGVIAIGLLVGTWIGRARSMIGWGIVLTVALVPGTLVANWDTLMGRHVMVAEADPAALPGEPVNHAVGQLIYDLSALELDEGQTVDLELHLAVGSMQIIVPEDVDVAVDGNVTLGNMQAFDEAYSGFGQQRQIIAEGPAGIDGGTIELDLDVSVGNIQIERTDEAGPATDDGDSSPLQDEEAAR